MHVSGFKSALHFDVLPCWISFLPSPFPSIQHLSCTEGWKSSQKAEEESSVPTNKQPHLITIPSHFNLALTQISPRVLLIHFIHSGLERILLSFLQYGWIFALSIQSPYTQQAFSWVFNFGNGVSAGTATLVVGVCHCLDEESKRWLDTVMRKMICQHGCQLPSTCCASNGDIFLGKWAEWIAVYWVS